MKIHEGVSKESTLF